MLFKGACTALSVPYTQDGINFTEFERLIRFQIENGISAVVVNGTTGEPATMTYDEKKAIVKFATEIVKGEIPVIVGIGGNNTHYCTLLADNAYECGADAVLAVTPYYNKCTPKGLLMHFTEIADKSKLPVILYNVPSRTNVNLTTRQADILADHKNIIAIKEACGDLNQVRSTIEAVADRIDVYSGNDDQNVDIIEMGGSGVISVLADIVPAYVSEMIAKALAGDIENAYAMQDKAQDLISALFCEVSPIPVKTALRSMGFNMGPFRLPLCEMEEDNRSMLLDVMKEFGIEVK